MNLTVLQSDFQPKLSVVNRFVSSRSQLPILSNVKLKAENNKLVLTATNLETSICAKIGASIEKPGDITIPARALLDLVSNMDGQIFIETVGENTKVVSEEFNSTISGINSVDFPDVPSSSASNSLKIDSKVFSENLPKVLFSASPDDTRPALSGILMIFEKEKVTLVSSDGFRLSKVSMMMPGSTIEDRLILPKNTLLELSKLITKLGDSFNLSFDKSQAQVIFDTGDFVLSSRIIEGEYPNFEKIIPQSHATKVSVDKESLLKHIKTAAVFARDGSNTVDIAVDQSEITMSSESNKLGSHKSKVSATVEGESQEIRYNYRYVEEFLNVIKGEDIIIELTSSASAGVFKDKSDINYLHLIMPVRG